MNDANELVREPLNKSHRVHGSYAKYVIEKCRCEPCRRANSEYERDRARRHAIEKWHPEQARWVDAEPVRKHLRSLMASGKGQTDGVGLKQMVKVAGVSHGLLWKLMYGKPRPDGTRTPSKRIRRDNAEKLLALSRDHMAAGARVDELETRRTWHLIEELIAWYNGEIGTHSGNGMAHHPAGGKTWLGRILSGNPAALSLQLSRRSIKVRHVHMVRDLHDQTLKDSEAFRWRYCKCDDEALAELPTKVPVAALLPYLEGVDLGELERHTGIHRRQLSRLRNSPEDTTITIGLFDRVAVGLGRPELTTAI